MRTRASRRTLQRTKVDSTRARLLARRSSIPRLRSIDSKDEWNVLVGEEGFVRTSTSDVGLLKIEPIRWDTLDEAASLLCRAFAGTPEGRPIKIVTDGLEGALEDYEQGHRKGKRGVFLVGTLMESRQIVGTAAVSFCESTREELEPVPPKDVAYLSNVAVSTKMRRKGVGRELVRAAEDAARFFSNKRELFLHVRSADPAALALYLSEGYEEFERERSLSLLFSKRSARLLMRKVL